MGSDRTAAPTTADLSTRVPPTEGVGPVVLPRDPDPTDDGSSWEDIESILDFAVSDTTLRARRDDWITAGVFEAIHTEALDAFDRIIGLDLTEVAIDGSLHKAPYGGEGTGPNPL